MQKFEMWALVDKYEGGIVDVAPTRSKARNMRQFLDTDVTIKRALVTIL